MKIDGRRIGQNEPPYIVAELSANHNGSLSRACAIIGEAQQAGADAVKVQIYDPDKLAAARGGRDKVLAGGPWAGRSLLDLYSEGHTPISWLPKMQEYAAKKCITLFASVFHVEDVEALAAFGVPSFKISSFDLTNRALVCEVSEMGKPMIMSTGMASIGEIGGALKSSGSVLDHVALLHCVSDYPCPIEKANLGRIEELHYKFQVPVGFSDHTLGNTAAIAAVARGACIIEKHLTLNRADGGLDSSFSSEPHEFAEMVKACRDAWLACQESEPADAYKDLRVTA